MAGRVGPSWRWDARLPPIVESIDVVSKPLRLSDCVADSVEPCASTPRPRPRPRARPPPPRRVELPDVCDVFFVWGVAAAVPDVFDIMDVTLSELWGVTVLMRRTSARASP